VIFQGSSAYISPSWYRTKAQTGKVVPTWNYAVVHAHGAVRFIDDRDWLRGFVDRLTRRHEAGRRDPWHITDAPPDYIETMLGAIIGLEIPIARLVGKWKVSQTVPPRIGLVWSRPCSRTVGRRPRPAPVPTPAPTTPGAVTSSCWAAPSGRRFQRALPDPRPQRSRRHRPRQRGARSLDPDDVGRPARRHAGALVRRAPGLADRRAAEHRPLPDDKPRLPRLTSGAGGGPTRASARLHRLRCCPS
jgi:hypothetical protein